MRAVVGFVLKRSSLSALFLINALQAFLQLSVLEGVLAAVLPELRIRHRVRLSIVL